MQVIIVGDDANEIEWLQSAIASSGLVTALGFTHPAAALDWCQENEPDLVLASYLMRAIDGVEFTRRLHALPGRAGIPLLLLHPPEAAIMRADAMRHGVTDFLLQPVDLMELAARASTLLALRQARLELRQYEWRDAVSCSISPPAGPSVPASMSSSLRSARAAPASSTVAATERSGWRAQLSITARQAQPCLATPPALLH